MIPVQIVRVGLRLLEIEAESINDALIEAPNRDFGSEVGYEYHLADDYPSDPLADLERFMKVAQDIKKEFVYNKSEGFWYWHDRGTESELSEPFQSFWDALNDAVEPYVNQSE